MQALVPDFRYDHVTEIDPKVFRGKKLLIFDIDNTLFYPETTKIDPKILSWFQKIKKKYPCVCFSNSTNIVKRRKRIESILSCSLYVSKRKKPSKKLFAEIVSCYNVTPDKVAVVGDLRITDVFFGNRGKATTILVKPMSKKEKVAIKLARVVEKVVVFVSGKK